MLKKVCTVLPLLSFTGLVKGLPWYTVVSAPLGVPDTWQVICIAVVQTFDYICSQGDLDSLQNFFSFSLMRHFLKSVYELLAFTHSKTPIYYEVFFRNSMLAVRMFGIRAFSFQSLVLSKLINNLIGCQHLVNWFWRSVSM